VIKLYLEEREIALNSFIFPGGENHFETPVIASFNGIVRIETDFQNPNDFMTLMLLSDYIDDRTDLYSSCKKVLVMHYTPYARQDRRTSCNEPFSFKTFARLINSCCFNRVQITDPHSDVITALLNNVYSVPRHYLMKNSGFEFEVLVSPDAGAMKANHDVCRKYHIAHVIATKHRDVSTGAITETKIHTDIDLKGKRILVADDLCDGGRTFIELAKVIRKYEPSTLQLYVTHGLFSNGLTELLKYYDKVHCHYDCKSGEERHYEN
jgi:ribose-phosphate pyrophosphokinase